MLQEIKVYHYVVHGQWCLTELIVDRLSREVLVDRFGLVVMIMGNYAVGLYECKSPTYMCTACIGGQKLGITSLYHE
jgi:hypothetical protein